MRYTADQVIAAQMATGARHSNDLIRLQHRLVTVSRDLDAGVICKAREIHGRLCSFVQVRLLFARARQQALGWGREDAMCRLITHSLQIRFLNLAGDFALVGNAHRAG